MWMELYFDQTIVKVVFSYVCEGASAGAVAGRPAYCCSGEFIPGTPEEVWTLACFILAPHAIFTGG